MFPDFPPRRHTIISRRDAAWLAVGIVAAIVAVFVTGAAWSLLTGAGVS